LLLTAVAYTLPSDLRMTRIYEETGPRMGREMAITRRCERAVVTAYSELRQVGSDDLSAFKACTSLYRIHHPEASMNEARRLVAEWIDHHLLSQEAGPTDGCACH
jgi:hypothetical protein